MAAEQRPNGHACSFWLELIAAAISGATGLAPRNQEPLAPRLELRFEQDTSWARSASAKAAWDSWSRRQRATRSLAANLAQDRRQASSWPTQETGPALQLGRGLAKPRAKIPAKLRCIPERERASDLLDGGGTLQQSPRGLQTFLA